jgi:hypothetical protein
VLIAAALLVLATLLLLLLTPARVVLRVAGDLASGIEVTLSWRLLVLRGGRRRRLTLAQPGAGTAAVAEAPRQKLATGASTGAARTPRAATRDPSRDTSSGARHDHLAELERVIMLVQNLAARRAVRITGAGGWLEFALTDVGETGRAFGFVCALATLIDPAGRLELRPRWDTEEWLAADLTLEARVYPLRTLLLVYAARRHRRTKPPADAAVPNDDGGSLAA